MLRKKESEEFEKRLNEQLKKIDTLPKSEAATKSLEVFVEVFKRGNSQHEKAC